MSVPATRRKRFRVRGIVQGVGFRPYVYALATRLNLSGFVLNDTAGVVIEVEGDERSLGAFASALADDPPRLATIRELDEQDVPREGTRGFEIRDSARVGERTVGISPDVATCVACLEEIADPGNRRYRYAFTNCTNCGPRFTITKGVPYDRPNTTMVSFEMCAECKSEYEDPADRRYHAQPIACPQCGPRLRLVDRDGGEFVGDPMELAATEILGGSIIAVKGLGGYHLACDASNERAVSELRVRKAREEKPFAVMVANLESACRVAATTPEETAALASRRRPIVLVRRRDDAPVARSVAPTNRYLGMMLPYTPLHHLLLREVRGPIVLTSGNISDEPIAYQDEDAFRRLRGVADAFITHDRRIHMRCDDSVVRVVDGSDYPIRRARGFAPAPLTVTPSFRRPVLGAGPELKHTFCLGVGDSAIVSHHIGDLENWETMSAFVEGIEHFTRVYDVEPEVVAYDLHPEYLSTKWAKDLGGVDKVGVQHHHAHIASCLADNRRAERVVGLALDGTGFGDDGSLWGCEVLVCDTSTYRRALHLRYVAMPGGAAAIHEPWRMAAVYLNEAFGDRAAELDLGFVRRTRERWSPILAMAQTGTNAPLASSAGRLFDAAAALCDIRDRVSYEGQAAAELEQVADPFVEKAYPCSVGDGVIDGVELIAALGDDRSHGAPPSEAAAAFHNGLARALVQASVTVARDEGLTTVALSGGTFQNLRLLDRVRSGLAEAGLEVLIHHRVPPNDGGISLGQAVVANARLTGTS